MTNRCISIQRHEWTYGINCPEPSESCDCIQRYFMRSRNIFLTGWRQIWPQQEMKFSGISRPINIWWTSGLTIVTWDGTSLGFRRQSSLLRRRAWGASIGWWLPHGGSFMIQVSATEYCHGITKMVLVEVSPSNYECCAWMITIFLFYIMMLCY